MYGSVYTRLVIATVLLLGIVAAIKEEDKAPANEEEILPSFWERLARQRFEKTNTYFSKPTKSAKNAILFLGDGMGLPTIAAARFYKAEVEGNKRKANPTMDFEDWPFHTLCRTYDLYTEVTDSASSSTAYLGGAKTTTGILGLSGNVRPKTCGPYKEEDKIDSVLKAAIRAGKATGLVTTSRVTHASPAGAFAHIAFREWESDKHMSFECPVDENQPKDIARQLLEDNPDINVIIGGGTSMFYPKEVGGDRKDGRYLGDEWLYRMKKLNRSAVFINDAISFMETNFSGVDYLLALMSSSHMPYEADRDPEEASIVNMTTTAIEILSRQPNGFFLFVESARIDHAHHENFAKKSLIDMLVFEEAIRTATKMVDLDETLVILTADHSHAFHLVGEPRRIDSLLDLDQVFGPTTLDRKGMTPLIYTSGPGAAVNASRKSLNNSKIIDILHDDSFRQPALVPLASSSHGGEDVAVYATGIFSHLFHSTVDNTFIAQSIKYAMCLSPFETEPHCNSAATLTGISGMAALITFLLEVVYRM